MLLTDFCFCLAGSRDCQDGGGGGERGGYPGRGRGQGRSQDKRGRESGRTRRDNRACVLVTDRARERGWDPMPRGSQRWPWIRARSGTDSQSSELGNIQTSSTPFLGLGKKLGRVIALIWCPSPGPSAGQPAHCKGSLNCLALQPGDPWAPHGIQKVQRSVTIPLSLSCVGARANVDYATGSEGETSGFIITRSAFSWGAGARRAASMARTIPSREEGQGGVVYGDRRAHSWCHSTLPSSSAGRPDPHKIRLIPHLNPFQPPSTHQRAGP